MRDSNENRADIHQEKRIIREEGEKKMLYEQVKANVTTKQAAIRYGLKPDGNGMVQCPFHCDRTPSMKVDERYYCFGCHCTGDVIDFTARLHGLNPKAAALRMMVPRLPESEGLTRIMSFWPGMRKTSLWGS